MVVEVDVADEGTAPGGEAQLAANATNTATNTTTPCLFAPTIGNLPRTPRAPTVAAAPVAVQVSPRVDQWNKLRRAPTRADAGFACWGAGRASDCALGSG